MINPITIDPEKVKGYEKLEENQQALFGAFLRNFTEAWGTEARATLKPISVTTIKNGQLRFNYRIYGNKKWLHVAGPHAWY